MLGRLKFDIDTLVNQMLNQIPNAVIVNGTVLDPAIGGGQFVKEVERRKRAAGKTDAEIAETVFGIEQNVLRKNYAVNKHKLVGNYNVDNFLEKDFKNMKFDVVLGNPPYQDSTGQNTLYPWFYSKSIELVKPNGIIAMITPPAIIPGLWGVKDPDGIKMPAPIQINSITIGKSVKDHFPGVSSDFCYFILQNKKSANDQVVVVTDAGSVISAGPLFPRVVEAKDLNKAQSILNKAFSFYKDPYKSTSGDHGKSAKFDPNGTDLAVESISTDGQVKTRSITWVKNNHQHYNKPKVIMPMYGKTAIIDYSHKLVSAAQEKNGSTKLTGHNIQTVITNSDQESETLVSILESRLQRFFNTVTNENRSQYINFLKNFKGVPLNQSYTDDTLEKALGLTKDESKWLRDNY
jgi:16S rRNA G966 N2-methylase RsmD